MPWAVPVPWLGSMQGVAPPTPDGVDDRPRRLVMLSKPPTTRQVTREPAPLLSPRKAARPLVRLSNPHTVVVETKPLVGAAEDRVRSGDVLAEDRRLRREQVSEEAAEATAVPVSPANFDLEPYDNTREGERRRKPQKWPAAKGARPQSAPSNSSLKAKLGQSGAVALLSENHRRAMDYIDAMSSTGGVENGGNCSMEESSNAQQEGGESWIMRAEASGQIVNLDKQTTLVNETHARKPLSVAPTRDARNEGNAPEIEAGRSVSVHSAPSGTIVDTVTIEDGGGSSAMQKHGQRPAQIQLPEDLLSESVVINRPKTSQDSYVSVNQAPPRPGSHVRVPSDTDRPGSRAFAGSPSLNTVVLPV